MSPPPDYPSRYSDVDLEGARREVRAKLAELIESQGEPKDGEARRWEAMLRDVCPRRGREVHALSAALRVGALRDLQMGREGLPLRVVFRTSIEKIRDELGLSVDMANWAMESWALALGVLEEGQTLRGALEDATAAGEGKRSAGVREKFGPTRRIAHALQDKNTKEALVLGAELQKTFPEDRLVRHLNMMLWNLHLFGRYMALWVSWAVLSAFLLSLILRTSLLIASIVAAVTAICAFIALNADEGKLLHRFLTWRTMRKLDAIAVGDYYWFDKVLAVCAKGWHRISEGRTPGKKS